MGLWIGCGDGEGLEASDDGVDEPTREGTIEERVAFGEVRGPGL